MSETPPRRLAAALLLSVFLAGALAGAAGLALGQRAFAHEGRRGRPQLAWCLGHWGLDRSCHRRRNLDPACLEGCRRTWHELGFVLGTRI